LRETTFSRLIEGRAMTDKRRIVELERGWFHRTRRRRDINRGADLLQ
jgi:hypothetical protein